jgi:hypothetical protein
MAKKKPDKPSKNKLSTQDTATAHAQALAAHAHALTAHALALSAHAQALSAAAAPVDTRSRVEGIIRGYGMVPVVNGGTIVGPAVPSMSHFIGDVNTSFGKDYGPDTLKPEWDVDITAHFIDTH